MTEDKSENPVGNPGLAVLSTRLAPIPLYSLRIRNFYSLRDPPKSRIGRIPFKLGDSI